MRLLPSSVLFVCTSNAIRSPMAEGLVKRLYGQRIFVDSVGVRATTLDGFALAVMAEEGIDLARHRAKGFDDLEDGSFDLVIALSPEGREEALRVTRAWTCDFEYWPTIDPSLSEGPRDQRLVAYRAVRDQIKARILARFGAPHGAGMQADAP